MTVQFETRKTDLSKTRIRETAATPLADGAIRVRIDRFALTANNITYGVVGEKIGYWRFFPATEDGWGIIPVWGVGVVEDSRADGVATGERLYGYWPMASHVDLTPDRLRADSLFDGAPHRADLPAVYNRYLRLSNDPADDPARDDERMALWPLYATSFCLYDFLIDNDWFGAEQVVIVSASSKTAIGTAYAIRGDANAPRLIGVTSPGNADKVRVLTLYDDVVLYDEIESRIDAGRRTVIIDMSGSGAVVGRMHKLLGDQMAYTSNVGVTHYEDAGMGPDYIRDRSAMFFAPGHIAKRTKEWGPGEFERRAAAFWSDAAEKSRSWLTINRADGAANVEAAWREVLEGRTPADQTWALSLSV